jgi:hypothetical protein
MTILEGAKERLDMLVSSVIWDDGLHIPAYQVARQVKSVHIAQTRQA